MTGTRGKSTVVRLIASILREKGFRVLAKTTGSVSAVIFPGGEEREMERRGSPSILEVKKYLKTARDLGVDALVEEIMSIHPECGFAESNQMLRPHILIISNVQLDHMAQMGTTRKEIAESLAACIPPGCSVFVLQEECFPIFFKQGEEVNSKIILLEKDEDNESLQSLRRRFPGEFGENLHFALAVSKFLHIEKKYVIQGIKKTRPDFGSLKAWKAEIGFPPRMLHFVSAFAANDPLSTRKALKKVEKSLLLKGKKIFGLLNLRYDRGDRTLQWAEALEEEYFKLFCKIVLVGGHSNALKRKLKSWEMQKISIAKEKSPQKIMAEISAMGKGEIVLIGMGNMGGAGQELVRYWERMGESCDF